MASSHKAHTQQESLKQLTIEEQEVRRACFEADEAVKEAGADLKLAQQEIKHL